MMRVRRILAVPVAMAVLLVPGAVSASAASAATASAATALPCRASMSNSHPADYTTIDVRVQTAGYAGVTTVAHYKTVNRSHTGKANSKGNGAIAYYISGATSGYRVNVSVRVTLEGRSGSCSTWFTPHR